MKKRFVIAGIVAALVLVPAAIALGFFGIEIFKGDTDHLDRQKILDILTRETVVYYADGQTQLGSLFGNEHRQYVPIREIPQTLQDAVISAEDDGFYHHSGVDLRSTLRAAIRTLFYGKTEGASTITQQTVKNLYGRERTNLVTKLKEVVNSLKLERKYTKQEILEFYLNQFHVTGNGRGVGVAARYYFDKDVQDLSLTEAAFIAGSVKFPVKYNPFTKRSAEAQAKSRQHAKDRKNYVLRRMLETGKLAKEAFEAARAEEVPFKQGRFQFNELFVTELVRRQIGRPEVLQAVGLDNVDDVGTSGLRITTTLEAPVQLQSQYGVRQNLSRLEMILSGFQKEGETAFRNIQKPDKYGFYVGKIVKIDRTPKKESLSVSFGVPECAVPTDAVDRVAKITDQALYQGLEKSKAALLKTLSEGDFVMASVRELNPDGGIVCDLERRPRIQGALIVLDRGRIISMVGGYSPYEYNRAVFARRQPGSTFKSMTYLAALQLGWNPLEPLVNTRAVYNWQDQFYYPRPDHPPETLETNFAGAGAKSENLASIWLLSRLLDKLTYDQFKDLLVALELMQPGEAETDWFPRLARKFNVRLSEHQLRAGVFQQVKEDFADDVSVARDRTLRALVRSMQLGHGFENEMARVLGGKGGLPKKEREVRLHVLRNTFLRWQRVANEAREAVKALSRFTGPVEEGVPSPQISLTASERALVERLRVSTTDGAISYLSMDAVQPEILSPLMRARPLQAVRAEELVQLAREAPDRFAESNLLLDGVMPAHLVSDISGSVEQKLRPILGAPALEKLFWQADFKYSLGMYYASRMTHEMGIESEVQWVPSFPLGANVVSLAELALSYQTMLDGKTYQYFSSDQRNQLLLVKRIEDAQGNLLWEPEGRDHQLFDRWLVSPMMSILRGTVTSGTGRAANSNVLLNASDPGLQEELAKLRMRVPSFGKTGTTNNYVNATYVGFLPYPAGNGTKQLDAEHAYTIAAYVGYDANQPMTRRGFKVAGGTGALPAWIETAKALIKEEDYPGKIEWKRLVEQGLREIPFDFGAGIPAVSLPVHGGVASTQEAPDGNGDEKADLNQAINDYAGGGSTISVHFPGRFRDGLFSANSKVAFFQPPKKPGAAPAAASQPNPPGENENGNGAAAPAPAANPAVTPTEFVAPQLEDDVGEDEGATPENPGNGEIPPPPPGLGN